jgi:hypothetical protein
MRGSVEGTRNERSFLQGVTVTGCADHGIPLDKADLATAKNDQGLGSK